MTDSEVLYLRQLTRPDFFNDCQDPALAEMQSVIRTELAGETAVLSIQIDDDMLQAASEYLSSIGWTVEEACILFIKWCIVNPDRIDPWLNEIQR